MYLTKAKARKIEEVIARLKSPNIGCSNHPIHDEIVQTANDSGLEVATRLYIETWIIPQLEMIVAEKDTP